MTKPKHKLPVQSFDPKLKAVLLRGALESFEVSMPYGQACRFRQRIYQMRNTMRLTAHPDYEMVSNVKIAIVWEDGTGINTHDKPDRLRMTKVIIGPHDSEFNAALAAAGISVDLTTTPHTTEGEANDFFAELGVKKDGK